MKPSIEEVIADLIGTVLGLVPICAILWFDPYPPSAFTAYIMGAMSGTLLVRRVGRKIVDGFTSRKSP